MMNMEFGTYVHLEFTCWLLHCVSLNFVFVSIGTLIWWTSLHCILMYINEYSECTLLVCVQ